MTFKMTDTNHVITIYNLSSVTNEFVGKGDRYIPASTGLLTYCTDITPPVAKDEFIAVSDSESGERSLTKDHQGKIVHNVHTGADIITNQLGKLSDDVVSVAPGGHFVKWDGEKWVHDTDAEKTAQITQTAQQKESLLALATSKIAPLQDTADLDIVTEAETVLILAWKKYRVLSNRIKPNNASYNNWPGMPGEG